jgi:hypothetical protein
MPVPKNQTPAGLEPAGGSDVANGSAVGGLVRDVAYPLIDDTVTLQFNERSGMQYLYCSGAASYPQYPQASAKPGGAELKLSSRAVFRVHALSPPWQRPFDSTIVQS